MGAYGGPNAANLCKISGASHPIQSHLLSPVPPNALGIWIRDWNAPHSS